MIEYVVHRINEIEKLAQIPHRFGIEIDIRAYGSELILNHEPFLRGDRLVDYLDAYKHGLLVLNIKEAGIEDEVLRLVKSHGISDYFLLDCEFPYIYRSTREGVHQIAMRYSEDEPIEAALNYRSKADWVWVDTNTQLPLSSNIIEQLDGFKTCLVCPERWGRSHDIAPYAAAMKSLSFQPDAIMTGLEFIQKWENAWK
jgi:hypothetical protein